MARSGAASAWTASRPVFAALGDLTRLRIVEQLCARGPLSGTRLAEGARVSRQAAAKHLRVLAGVSLVDGVREGRETLWRLDPRGLADARRLLDAISRGWDERLERLRALVEMKP